MNSITQNSKNLVFTFVLLIFFYGSSFAQSETSEPQKLESSAQRESKSVIQSNERKVNTSQSLKVNLPDSYNSSNTESNRTHVLPDDFPKFIDSGNPEADAADYKQRKLEWIENNPERYNELTKGSHKTGNQSDRNLPLRLEKKNQ